MKKVVGVYCGWCCVHELQTELKLKQSNECVPYKLKAYKLLLKIST